MTANARIEARVEQSVVDPASRILERAGLTVQDAVRLLLIRIVQDGALPFEIDHPNAETRAAMAEADAIIRVRRMRFASADELFAALDDAAASDTS